MSSGTFYVGNVAHGCPKIADESCDLVITSPPYFKRDGYSDKLMDSLGVVLARVLKPGRRAYIVFGQTKEGLDRPQIAQQRILTASNGKLTAGQTIIWVKSIAVGGWVEKCGSCGHKTRTEEVSRGHFTPINSPHLLNYCWEYVFCVIKKPTSELLPLNRHDIGVAYADKSNIKRWKSAQKATHCPGDIWFLPYETTGASVKKTHRHEFPLELAKRLVSVSGIPVGSVVFDPFAGGGTTCFAANRCGMNALGYDVNPDTVADLTKRWSTYKSKAQDVEDAST